MVLDQVQDVEAAAAAAAADRGFVEPAPDVAVFQRGQGGLVAGLDQGEQEFAVVSGGPGGFGGAGGIVLGQSGQVAGVVEQQGRGFHPFLDPLAELGAEPRQFGVDRPEPVLTGVVQLDPGGAELLEVFRHKPGRLRVQAVEIQCCKAVKEATVEVDGVLMRREQRGQPVSSSRIVSDASAETRVKNAAVARASRRPDCSMATAVFSNDAGAGSSTIRRISASCSARPASMASAKWVSSMAAKGGSP